MFLQKFYTDIFGWQMQDIPEMGYTLVHTVETDQEKRMPKEPGAINGGMFKRQADMPHPQFFMDVNSIEETLNKQAMSVQAKHVNILKAKFGNEAGLIGAAIMVKEGL